MFSWAQNDLTGMYNETHSSVTAPNSRQGVPVAEVKDSSCQMCPILDDELSTNVVLFLSYFWAESRELTAECHIWFEIDGLATKRLLVLQRRKLWVWSADSVRSLGHITITHKVRPKLSQVIRCCVSPTLFVKKATRQLLHKENKKRYRRTNEWRIYMFTVIWTPAGSVLIRQNNVSGKMMLNIPIKYQLHKSLMMAKAQNPFRQFPHYADDFHWHNNSQ